MSKRILFIVSEDWYFFSHRLCLAVAAIDAGYDVALLSRFSQHRDAIEEEGIRTFQWSLLRYSLNPLSEVRALFGMFSAVRAFCPDLIHAVALKPVIYSAIVRRLLGVDSFVATLGGLGYIFNATSRKAKMARLLLPTNLSKALNGSKTLLILQNPDDASFLLRAKIAKSNQIRLIRGAGVDTDQFSLSPLPSGGAVVLLPARMLWAKGVGAFVELARAVNRERKVARFVLVGGTDSQNPDSVPVERLMEWHNEGVVEWWGRRKNMVDVYRQSTIVCLPTRYGEGVPKSLLEAASCGRPIVTYDVPGCREIVIDQVNGFLVDIDGKDTVIELTEKLLVDPNLCKRMGRAGRELVEREFSQGLVVRKTMDVWCEVCQ